MEAAVPPADSVTGLTLNAVVGPGGDTEAERLTDPAKLLTLVRVRVDPPDDSWMNVRKVGLDAIVKSGGGAVTMNVPRMLKG